jgi:hypothetical protein
MQHERPDATVEHALVNEQSRRFAEVTQLPFRAVATGESQPGNGADRSRTARGISSDPAATL